MAANFQALTLTGKGRLDRINTKCGICAPFDPLKDQNRKPKIKECTALWDTGASGTCISKKLAQELNLKPISKAKVFHAGGSHQVNVYAINLYLPNQVAFSFVKVTEGTLNGMDVLIGMDIITMGDFSITNVGMQTTFSFRIPSIQKVDYVQEHRDNNAPVTSKKVGRNDPCPCGSGKKFKHCHGKKK